uniref:Solute carrier family 22 member 6 n=1 Tax=Scleropages formosus TaxID=113540 RepID=A0A8C9RD68_SCLFO
MKFDTIIAEINGFGQFQVMVILLQCISRFTLPFHFLLNNFIAAVPSHHCNIAALDDRDIFKNLSQEQRLTVSIPAQEDGTLSSCEMFPQPQLHLLYGPSNTTDTPAAECQNGWVYDTSTFTSTIATEWDLVCGKKGMTKGTATIFFIGLMCGAVVFGILSDRFGRKTMLLVTYLLALTFGLASAFSTSYMMFAIMRFFTGFSLTGISIISIILSVEWCGIENRTVAGVIVSLDWSLGSMMLSGIAYLVNDWRWLIVAVTSPLFLAVIAWWWLPESARWLIVNGKVKRAHMYLEKCAKMNNRAQFMSEIMPETLSYAKVKENSNRKYTYLDLIRTPNIRKLSLFTGIVWYGVAFTYYGISLNIGGFNLNIYLTQFIYGAIEMPAKIGTYFCLNKFGRRTTQVGTLFLTGVCIAINLFVPNMGVFRTVVAVLGKGLAEASFTTIYLYTAELYPTVVRQNGLGYVSCMGRLGVSMAPLVLLLEDVWRPLPQVIFCSVVITSSLMAWLLPETLNARLPETIEDIEARKNTVDLLEQEKADKHLKCRNSDGNEN